MSLSTAFNKDPHRREQLDLLESALVILQAQKEASHQNRSMHGEIAETRRFIRQWGGDAGDGETLCRIGGTPNPRAADIAEQQEYLNGLQGAVVEQLAGAESRLLAVMDKVFSGDAEKLKKFYASARPANDYLALKWTGAAAQAYEAPSGVTLQNGVAVAAIVAKFAGPKAVESQIEQVNALIDDGRLANTVKRLVWQVGRSAGLTS